MVVVQSKGWCRDCGACPGMVGHRGGGDPEALGGGHPRVTGHSDHKGVAGPAPALTGGEEGGGWGRHPPKSAVGRRGYQNGLKKCALR